MKDDFLLSKMTPLLPPPFKPAPSQMPKHLRRPKTEYTPPEMLNRRINEDAKSILLLVLFF